MTVLRRHTGAAILAIAGSLALLSQTAKAQSNICYPKPNKRSPLKKGPCFMVSHTLVTSLGLDHPAALDPLGNDFILVDRHSGDPISPACKRTKVYVSTDATDVDLGHFKRENWATQAMTLVEGKLQVDHEAIEANLAATQNRKADKHAMTELETIFMVEFECPSSPGASEGKWRTKQPRSSNFRAALRYVPNPGEFNAVNYYQKFFQHLFNLYGRTVETGIQADVSVSSSSSDAVAANVPLSDSPPEFGFGDIIHNPICPALFALDPLKFCLSAAAVQDQSLNFINDLSLPTCPGVYPDYMQGLVNQSKGLGTDKGGKILPGALDDMRTNNGYLIDQVPWDTIKTEKATLFWLFDKTQQLGPWAVCDDGTAEVPGEVPYELTKVFAPNFGPTQLYYMYNYHELDNSYYHERGFSGGSNFTETAIAQSAVGPDADGKTTFVLAFRGTRARSEWISDFKYNQINVNLLTLINRQLLEPFLGMAIHAGFAEIFEQVWLNIVDEVAIANPDRIIVTGHSLGGGMATLLAYALAWEFEEYPIQVDAALFAPPTVGDSSFADAFNYYVNGRRVAYVTHQPDSLELPSTGDIVPQLMCPLQYVCDYPATELIQDVPVQTKFPLLGDVLDIISYTAVGGNVLFDYRHFPDAPADYGLPVDIIRDTWLALDDSKFELNAHICSYSCFLSSEVNADLNKCFMKPADANNGTSVNGMTIGAIKQKLPPNVQQYGLC